MYKILKYNYILISFSLFLKASASNHVCRKLSLEPETVMHMRNHHVIPSAGATISSKCTFPFGKGQTWLSDVKCQGQERLIDCNNSGLGNTMCTLLDDVGVRCKLRKLMRCIYIATLSKIVQTAISYKIMNAHYPTNILRHSCCYINLLSNKNNDCMLHKRMCDI